MLKQGNKTWTKETELNQQWLKDCLNEMGKQNIIDGLEAPAGFTHGDLGAFAAVD